MRGDETAAERLRELLGDPRWSLPPWPDAEERVRKAARRQRRRVIGATTGLTATAAAAIAVPLTLLSSPSQTLSFASHGVLTCHDSAGQQDRDTSPARLVNGVDGFIGDTNAYDRLPTQYLAGQRYLAWKTALSVGSAARPFRTVTVISPASARLGYGNGPLAPARSVRLPVCGSRYTLYVGGIFVRHPACVLLAVRGPAGRTRTVSVPVLRRCPQHTR
jgi:hypothetical protein